jgi:hypothetical protein
MNEWVQSTDGVILTEENSSTEKNLSWCQFIHHKSHTDWPESKPSDWLLEACHSPASQYTVSVHFQCLIKTDTDTFYYDGMSFISITKFST